MKAQLEALADRAPIARLSSAELWRHGRRRRTRSRLTAALAALLALTAVGVPTALPSSPASPPGMILPARLEPPPFWQRTLHESPNGPVLLGFRMGSNLIDNLLGGVTDVYVGRDGSYRLDKRTGPKVISPDGRYVATWGENIDLSTGVPHSLGQSTDVPLAWSPDSGTLLVSANFGSGRPIFLNLITVATGRQRRLVDGIGGYDGAISPDGVAPDKLNYLAFILIAAAAGLIAGMLWEPIGIAAAAGLVCYFTLAIAAHIRADDMKNLPTPVIMLA